MSIEEQIEALTQELRPYPKGKEFYSFDPSFDPHDCANVRLHTLFSQEKAPQHNELLWIKNAFASVDKLKVDIYADHYKKLRLYQLLAEKAERNFPINWKDDEHKWATEFNYWEADSKKDSIIQGGVFRIKSRISVLGSVWFSREEDRLEALKICGIDRAFQEKCYELKLGGA